VKFKFFGSVVLGRFEKYFSQVEIVSPILALPKPSSHGFLYYSIKLSCKFELFWPSGSWEEDI
jgi:hypothetical protein